MITIKAGDNLQGIELKTGTCTDIHVSSSCEYCVDDPDVLVWHAKWSIKTTPKASPSKLMAVRQRSNSQSRANMTAKSAAKRSSDTACIHITAMARLPAVQVLQMADCSCGWTHL